MDHVIGRMTVGEVMELCQGMDPGMPFAELVQRLTEDSPKSGPKRKGSDGGIDPKGGFVTKASHFEVSGNGLVLKKVGNDGQWNTARIKPGTAVGSRKYFEFYLKKLKKLPNQQIVLGFTLESMPKDNFLGTTAFSWGYGTKYGHCYHKAADMPFAEQAKQGDTIGILMSGPAMYVYKNGKKLGRACELHGTGSIYGAVSLLHDGDVVVLSHPEPPA
eukprot:TRINITY_DN2408_c0_g1_i1.p1 TRINITY_DN2408_c0_g1~~TRINITY_DN2408_c0_g1_i1.p1  ORF type:complete len:217 (+),score=41.27 TRINITY_DN2408_c0_g1_i1:63-713(+)